MAAELVTYIECKFAGQVRRFDLMAPVHGASGFVSMESIARRFEQAGLGARSVPKPLLELNTSLTLSELAKRTATQTLSHDDVSNVIAYGMMCGDRGQDRACFEIVSGEMRGKPFAEFVTLATDIITAAYAGAEAPAKTKPKKAA